MEKLAILMLGEQDSGKSSVWEALFDADVVRTGKKERLLNLIDGKKLAVFLVSGSPEETGVPIQKRLGVEVFVVNGSPEETGKAVRSRLGKRPPRIVLCSVQYIRNAIETIDCFLNRSYTIKVIWLNPGASLGVNYAYADFEGLAEYLLANGAELSLRPGGKGPRDRRSLRLAQEVREKILGWAVYNIGAHG